MIRRLLGLPPYWMPTLKGPLRPLWPLYARWAWWRETGHIRHDVVHLRGIELGPVRSLREALPDLADHLEALGGDPDKPITYRVLATRTMARKVIETAGVSPERHVIVDCRGVRVMSPPFAHELLKAWPHATLRRANWDVLAAWDVAQEYIGEDGEQA